jgi:dephospho-CoA kinase
MTQIKKANSLTICLLGHARHGKDTVAEYFRDNFGMTFQSSSEAAAEIFIFDALKEKYGYKTFEECYQDRVNHRAEWYDLICEYNREDKARLARGIVEKTGCYVGMRDSSEIKACIEQKIFDCIIWVDASERKPLEPKDSFNIEMSDADFIIQNNGSLDELNEKLNRIGKIIFK